jgi:hypothetical protein
MLRRITSLLSFITFVVLTPFAMADLYRVGPIDPATGYPRWYQDSTGLALNLCVPNSAELLAGSCLIFAADLPNPSQPERFPDNFLDEHFWYNLNTSVPTASGGAKLIIGLEGAFPGPVRAGTQISFGRVRIVIDVPAPGGTYTVTHPYGVETFPDVAPGPRAISFTEDIGINCPVGDFTCALSSRIGPFLRAAATPGGAPRPAITLPGGNTYLADPAIPTAITGSPFPNNNIFKIEGPNVGGPGINVVQTTLFNLMARVHTAPIPSVTTVDRATYSRDANGAKIDVFAQSMPSIGSAMPNLSFAGTNLPPALMKATGNRRNFYGQAALTRPESLPASILVTNNGDVPPSKIEANLVDEVRISQAEYDSEKQVLTISASSSDALMNPALQAEGLGALLGGSLIVQGVPVPPPFVRVVSAAGGRSRMQVSTTSVGAADSLRAQNDSAVTSENQSVVIDVRQNDLDATAMTVTLLGAPGHGTATVDAAGLVTYMPAQNYFGSDVFTYVLGGAAGSSYSNIAAVTVDVAMVPIKPLLVGDTANVTLSSPAPTIVIDVLANDSAVNGTLDRSSVSIVQEPASGRVSVDGISGKISFTPTTVGVAVFSYTVRDSLGVVSDPATVSVTVSPAGTGTGAGAGGTIAINKAVASTSTSKGVTTTKWVVDGSASISSVAQSVTVSVFIGPTATGTPLGSAPVDTTGAWRLTIDSPRGPDATRTVSVKTSTGALQQGFPIK